MFKWLKSFFIKSNNQIDQVETFVKYSIDDDGDIFIDINLKDYSKESAKNLSTLICGFTDVVTHVQTLETIKNGFLNANREDLYDLFAKEMIDNISEDQVYYRKEDQEEESPCIKPSDML